MFWQTFWLTNLHFAGELFVALTSFLATYVLVEVWKGRKERKIALRALGFALFTLFSALHATGIGFVNLLLLIEFLAFLLIGISLYLDPVQLPPSVEAPGLLSKGVRAVTPLPVVVLWEDVLRGGLSFANLVLLAAIVRRLYLKYTKGLERELKNLFRGFGLLLLSEVVLTLTLFQNSSYLLLSAIGADLGPAWLLSHALKFAGFAFVAIWAWGYLRFKLFSQVVGAFMTASLFIFITITFVYTSLLVQIMQRNSLENLKINLQTFEYAIEKVKGQALATASVLASNSSLKEALRGKDQKKLSALSQEQMISSGVDFLAVVDKDGVVLARGEDPEVVGDSLSANFVISAALKGEGAANVATKEWVNAPQVLIEVGVPVDGLGAVYTGYILDNAFVDGVKEATGLDMTIFGGEVKSATTLVAADGISRLVGVRLTDERILSKVLGPARNASRSEAGGELFLGLSSVFQREFLSAYGPLKDLEDKILGMLFVGYPSTRLFEATQNSLNTTFLASSILALLTFIPAWVLAKFIEEHQV